MEPSLLPQTVGGWLGWVIAAATALFTIIAQWRKSRVDESALVLGKWKELVEAHESAIRRLNEDAERDRKRAAEEAHALRRRIAELEEQGKEKDGRIKALETELEGLKRTIIQNSKSTAQVLARPDTIATSKAVRGDREQ